MKSVEVKEINMCEMCPYKEFVYMNEGIMYADGTIQEVLNGHVECVHYQTCYKLIKETRDVIMGATTSNA